MKVYIKKKHQEIVPLSPEVRHFVFGASLRLLLKKFRCGKPIFKDDVIRLASMAEVVTTGTHRKREPERPPARQLKLKFDDEPPSLMDQAQLINRRKPRTGTPTAPYRRTDRGPDQ